MKENNIKWLRSRSAVLAVLILLAGASAIVWGTGRSSIGNTYQTVGNEIRTRSVEKLEGLRNKFANARSVHLAANAQIILYGANARAGAGTYEYWAEGDRYKMKCHTDSQLGFLKDVEVAYDGARFYFLDRGSAILSYQERDVPKTTGALPNPLFLPVDFLSSDDDDCYACALRWSDLKSHDKRWDYRLSGAKVRSQAKDEINGYTVTDLEMPGGTKAKRAFRFRVRMVETVNGDPRPIRIDRIGLAGNVLTSTTFENFVPSELGDFPRTITFEGYDDDSNTVARMVYTVNTLEVNQPVKNSAFVIAFDEAEGIWDSDEMRFIKEKRSPPKEH